jgi:TM2 domain-containing membrane protein YozV
MDQTAGKQGKFCPHCGAPVADEALTCARCGARATAAPLSAVSTMPRRKSKVVAGLLGIFLGGLGIHKFYLNQPGWGILYLVFSFTFIPAVVGFVEGILYLAMSDQSFAARYG